MIYTDYAIVAIALYGAWLNARGKRAGFSFWIVSNTYLAIKNFSISEHAQGWLFLAYLALALYGYATWKEKA
jgi:nicotinamide riboside transporter PnuC